VRDRIVHIAAHAPRSMGWLRLPAAAPAWFTHDERKPFQLEDSLIGLRRRLARRSCCTAAVRGQVRWHSHWRRWTLLLELAWRSTPHGDDRIKPPWLTR